jgi:hypothetical protein
VKPAYNGTPRGRYLPAAGWLLFIQALQVWILSAVKFSAKDMFPL